MWKKIFSKVDDEVEVVRVEQNENKTNIKVIYLIFFLGCYYLFYKNSSLSFF